jgi:2-phosphoglycerate kinase
MDDCRVLLIGGTSHVGKSAVAKALAARLGWSYRSTDHLARHPGRPWKAPPEQVPPHVVEHYGTLAVDELIVDVVRHYTVNVWPKVQAIVASHATGVCADGLVLEGSALLPELVTTLLHPNVAAVWLTASDELLRQRMYASSQYGSKSSRERALIDKFLQRTWAYNEQVMATVKRLGLPSIVVGETSSADELADQCLSTFGASTPAARG